MQQLSFDLRAPPAFGRGDFHVSPSNAAAVAAIDGWREWPGGKLILKGPRGSGKTHLAHVWAELAGARITHAGELPDARVAELAQAPLVIEDAQLAAGVADAEAHLFHLHNLTLSEGHFLLLTSSEEPSRWGLALPDLQSRMEGTHVVTLEPPDDELLGAVISKLFSDRQLSPNPDVIPYLLRHAPRSFAAAQAIVMRLDEMSMASGKSMSRDMARRALAMPLALGD